MAKKYDLISELYERTCAAVSENPLNWQGLLRTASYNFGLRFDEQLLLYAQRPDATAVLPIERWSGNFGRWVNRGSKGIVVFEDESRKSQRLIHYFDISDTHESRYARPVPLWKMKPEYESDVAKALENTFGKVSDNHSIESIIEECTNIAVSDNVADYLTDFQSLVDSSGLQYLSVDEANNIYIDLVKNSVSYMIISRLGLDTSRFTEESFRNIVLFNTTDTLNALGFATSDIAEIGLTEIARTINALEKQNRIITDENHSVYNKTENNERSNDNGKNQLFDYGRLQPSEPKNAEATGGESGTVRSDETEVSEGETQNSVLQSPNEVQNDRTFGGSRAESNRNGGSTRKANGERRRLERKVEGNRHDGVGTPYEQYSESGAGSGESGSNIRLEYYDRQHEDKSLPFFGKTADINEILLTTPHLKASKEEIDAFYEGHTDNGERTEYIKSIFNNDYTHLTLGDGRLVGYKTYQNVLHLWEGEYDSRTAQSFYDWSVIAQHFQALRLLGELTDEMKPLPSIDGQLSLILDNQAEEQKTSAFVFSQEIIDAVLTRGSNVSEGKLRIYRQFEQSLSAKENANFLTREYGIGGSYPVIIGTEIDESHDSKGIHISRNVGDEKYSINLNWNQVEKRIAELIRLDRYLSPKEKSYYPEWLQKEEELQAEAAEQRRNREILSTAPPQPETQTDEQEVRYEYHLGDSVYIGATEYEILSFDDDRVMLCETKMPLFNKEFTRKEFDRKIRETPINDHLKVTDTPAEEERSDDEPPSFDINEYDDPDYYEQRKLAEQEAQEQAEVRFSSTEFEKLIPHHMRFKEADVVNGNEMYWVTQGIFTVEDLRIFQQAVRNYDGNIKKFYITSRSISSSYTFEDDRANRVLATVTPDEILKDDYVRAMQKAGMEEYLEQNMSEEPEHIVVQAASKSCIPGYVVMSQFDRDDVSPRPSENVILGKEENYNHRGVYDNSDYSAITVSQNGKMFSFLDESKGWSVSQQHFLDDGTFTATDYTEYARLREELSARFPDFRTKMFETDIDREGSGVPFNPDWQNNQFAATVVPKWEQTKNEKAKGFDLHPDIPMSERHTFGLKANPVETVGKKERFRRNIMAIQLLKKCQEENRFATPDEQIILSKYVGWGGIPEAFDENNSTWGTEYLELRSVLTPEEYTAARESTLTAFYTPPEVTNAIYNALSQMGFREGNLLEPSCGIGNFIGMLPQSMENAKIYGVELDPISAGIAQQLYQKSSITACGFEEVNISDSFFDGVVGNVPFGDFKVLDKRYDKHNFLIHDYFFAKSLDKLRPGGVMALVTSKGTMDKTNPTVRKYIAQRSDLLGAIRLPNNTFKGNAGTEVVSDILFLQKRDRLIDIEPDWVHLDTDENGIQMNSYFVQHPEMVLGKMKMVTGRFGMESTCEPYEDADLESQLVEAVSNIHGEISNYEMDDKMENEDNSIPADPSVRNFSYTVVDDVIYFRENSKMTPVEVSATAENRIKGMIAIRDCVRELIELQTEDYPDSDVKQAQEKLNTLYDNFTKKYGLINSRANTSAFSDDSSYALLSALEVIDENGELERKADMFHKRTIKPHTPLTEVDTASEALAVSMSEKATIDITYMQQLTGKTEQEIFNDLKGVIFLNPLYGYGNSTEAKYLMADEYLSGNVRDKLAIAKRTAEIYPDDYAINVKALEKIQPKDLTASEISVRLGATWIPPEIVEQFIFEFLDTPKWAQWNIKVHYSKLTSEWSIAGKSYDRNNVKAHNTYGTSRINAYKIIEETLNLKDVRIFDYIEDELGKKKAVLNKKDTAIAQSKQELIKQGFQDWIWADPNRREKLTSLYNEKFNCIRPREYDGSHITFNGMNPEIELREHQKNAVAHILYGGNTLLAHAVGAGKTYEMVAAAQESKRLGLCNKSLFVVPNHLTEQWAAEYLQLYPAANILVATKKDFEMKNRKKFCGRIATGDYDAIIIGHSQFEKIPMSIERQKTILEQQLNEITAGIASLKHDRGESFSIKQLEKSRKSIKQKLEKLNDQSRKDDVVTFEELGVDRLFIDESHYYKNLYLYTKMRNVGGITQTEAQKSSDLFMKCRYLDEITGNRGVVFATGTPISNSMVELYTIQRYLQYATLEKNGLQHFDAWASTFGETVTAVELTPDGTGYRAKTRFARFYNLPELMAMFKEVADIKTADMLNLPVPKANFHNISVKPSEIQKEMVRSLAERAEKVHSGMVDASVDNMLKITNDGRKLALDQRLLNPMLPDFEGSKLNACVNEMFKTWEKGKEKRLTQLFFCDLSTPKSDGNFSVYDDIRKKLIEKGVPADEIKFIHEADTEAKKLELFKKVRRGEVRILMGSTQKMGAGTNVQDRLAASSDLDCPWRPSDLEQRLGRSIRQGNTNAEVDVFRFVTEETFDAYLYQLVEGKQKFASQIMTSKSPVRSAEDIDETALSYAEIKMLATGNPYIKEKMDLDIQVQKLKLLKSNYLSEKYNLEDKIIKYYPQRIASLHSRIEGLKADIKTAQDHPKSTDDRFVGMEVKGVFYSEKAEAGKAIINACKEMSSPDPIPLGAYRGFKTELLFDTMGRVYIIRLKGEMSHNVLLGDDIHGNITRLDNGIERFEEMLQGAENDLENTEKQFETSKEEVKKPFAKEDELKSKMARLDKLNILLNLDKKKNQSSELKDQNNNVDSNNDYDYRTR